MKHIVVLSLILFHVFSFSCQETKTTIGFLMDNENIERWKKDKSVFIEEVNKLGGEVLVEVAQSNAQNQYDQAARLIERGVDVLVIIPVDMEKAALIGTKAFEARIPVISYDRLIKNCPLACHVTTNNIEIGELQADYLKKVKGKGNYVLISGPESDNNATLLRKGWYNILQPGIDKQEIKIVKDYFAKAWIADEAYFIIKELINNKTSIDAIIAGNDVLASGALMALNEFNLQGKVLLAGQDAELSALRNIVAGNQTITIAKPIDKLAKAAAYAAMNIANGKNIEYNGNTTENGLMKVPTIMMQARIVNKKNIVLTLQWEDNIDSQDIYE